MRSRPLLSALGAEPRRFRFDAAIRVLTRARRTDDPAAAMRFQSPAGLVYPSAEIVELRQQGDAPPDVTVGLMGLAGPAGVLPRYYSELVTQTLRARSTALRDFVDLLAHRFVAFFARAGAKYRPARAAEVAEQRGGPGHDPVRRVLLALTGYGTGYLTDRLAAGEEALLHYAGLFALRPRSAERLGAMVADWLGMRVEIIEFAGAWLSLPPDQRTRLSMHGQWCQLGIDAAAGVGGG
ncbi:MAG TPA: type VI secretion system baseplate subunit TssG, partial [Acetobacteraceae bacterium]